MRYYSETRAEREIEKAKQLTGENEIHQCVSYLTSFVYGNIQRKRRLAMEDMHRFCVQAVQEEKELKKRGVKQAWLEVNENLKDFIYYYFNSKYAREGYAIGERPYSLLDDMKPENEGLMSQRGLLEKYMAVIDDDFLDGGSPKDNIQHLQGAVRLIARGRIEVIPVLSLLNVFCLCFIGFTGKTDRRIEEAQQALGEGAFMVYAQGRNLLDEPIWDLYHWFRKSVQSKTGVRADYLQLIFDPVRVSLHLRRFDRLMNRLV